MVLTKRTYKDNETVITAENLNQIQDEIIRIGTALDNGDFDGQDGKDGKDGYTPVKNVDYFDGKDGITPELSIGTVTTLGAGSNAFATITGSKEYPVLNLGIPKGADGSGGSGGGTGADGEDGGYYIPSVNSAGDLSWNATKADMPAVPTVNIKGDTGEKGADGYTPIKGVDYFDGQNGQDGQDGYTPVKGKDYFDGTNGKDGTSVTVSSVSESAADGGSNVVTFSDGKTLTVKNGKSGQNGTDGKTPVRGTDYWTAADIAEIKSYVDDAILGGAW